MPTVSDDWDDDEQEDPGPLPGQDAMRSRPAPWWWSIKSLRRSAETWIDAERVGVFFGFRGPHRFWLRAGIILFSFR